MDKIKVNTIGAVSGYSTLFAVEPMNFESVGDMVRKVINAKSESIKVGIERLNSGFKLHIISAGSIDEMNATQVIGTSKPSGNTLRYNFDDGSDNVQEGGEDLELAIDAIIDYLLDKGVNSNVVEVGDFLVVDQEVAKLAFYQSTGFASEFTSDEICSFVLDGASLAWEV